MIVLEDVRKHYGALEVIKGVSAEVTKGEVVCVIGPSGSGKSTLLRCINGLEAYDGGEIRVDGQRVDRDKRGIKAILNYAPRVVQVPDGVELRQIDPVIAMQSMTYHLTRNLAPS